MVTTIYFKKAFSICTTVVLRELHILKEIKYIYCLAAESYKLASNAATDILSTHKSIYNRSGGDRSIYQTTFLNLLLYTSRKNIVEIVLRKFSVIIKIM